MLCRAGSNAALRFGIAEQRVVGVPKVKGAGQRVNFHRGRRAGAEKGKILPPINADLRGSGNWGSGTVLEFLTFHNGVIPKGVSEPAFARVGEQP
jgi:hypothetical protein